MASVLTAKAVEAAKPDPQGGRREVPDGGLPGLYLVIQPSGTKSWALRYRFDGKSKKLTIGRLLTTRLSAAPAEGPALGGGHTLSEAREAARKALLAVEGELDPAIAKKAAVVARRPESEEEIASRKISAERDLVRTHAAAFVERWCKARNRSWREVARQFKAEINPILGDLDVKAVSKRHITGLVDGIVERNSPVTANRVFATLRRFFGWLVEKHIIAESPCFGIRKPTEEKPRERVLSDRELQLVWQATAAFEYPFGPLWRLLLLTGQRREEVAGMEWAELELSGNWPEWNLPGGRTKNGNSHSVPLSPLIVGVIGELPRGPVIGADGRKVEPKFVFSTTGTSHVSGYSRSKARLDVEIERLRVEKGLAEPMPAWGLHDLRRTLATGLASFGVRLEVVEKILNHVSGSFAGVAGIYQRHHFKDEMRQALDAWARHIELLVDESLWDKFQDWKADGDREEETARRRELNSAILEGGNRWKTLVSAIRGDAVENVLLFAPRTPAIA